MPSGKTTVDFGAFPGSTHATATVTGQSGITATSRVEAWIMPEATADHTEDEHMVDPPRAFVPVSSIVAGTGFTIHAFARDTMSEPLGYAPRRDGDPVTLSGVQPLAPSVGGKAPMPYGVYTVGWAWSES